MRTKIELLRRLNVLPEFLEAGPVELEPCFTRAFSLIHSFPSPKEDVSPKEDKQISTCSVPLVFLAQYLRALRFL